MHTGSDVVSRGESTSDRVTPIGFILAMEGADPIVAPSQVEFWFNLGLRVVGPVHYGHNQYAHGTGESGPLNDAGRCAAAGVRTPGDHPGRHAFVR